MRGCIGLILAQVLLFSSSSAQAAVLAELRAESYEIESGTGDFDSQLGFTTASTIYSNPNGGSAEAYATLTHSFGGGLIAKAFATATGGSGEGKWVSNRGSASAAWEDQLHYANTPEDVFVEFVFNFTGTTSGDAIGAAGFDAYDQDGNFLFGSTENTTGTLRFGGGHMLPESVTHYISISLSVDATGHGSGMALPHSSTASFANSFSLIAITPRDSAGNFLPDVVITADSGFDYNPLIREFVPEPTSATLMLMGLFAMLRRRALPRRKVASTV